MMQIYEKDHVVIRYRMTEGSFGSCISIDSVFVEPGFRGEGRYRSSLDELQELYDLPIVLESFETLVKMYEHHGFQNIGMCHPDGYYEMIRRNSLKNSLVMNEDLRDLNKQEAEGRCMELYERYADQFVSCNSDFQETAFSAFKGDCDLVHVCEAVTDKEDQIYYINLLQLLEPGKDPVNLVTCFSDDMGSFVGPVIYRYADGHFAAMEHYISQEADFSKLDMFKSVYFSPEGEKVGKHVFDSIFIKSLMSSGLSLENLNILPCFRELQEMANRFCMFFTKIHDESIKCEFREEISLWPEDKICFLKDLIGLNSHVLNSIPQEEVKAVLDQYLWGHFYDDIGVHVSEKLHKYREAHVDNSIKEICIDIDGYKRIEYGEFNYRIHGCYEVSDTFKYYEEYQDGIRKKAGFMTSTSLGEFSIGPSILFYPDGKVANISQYGYAGLETDVIYNMYFNSEGRLFNSKIVLEEFRSKWEKTRQAVQESKSETVYSDKKKPARKIYEEMCIRVSSNIKSLKK